MATDELATNDLPSTGRPATESTPAAWHLDTVVASLRALRNESLAARRRTARPVKLPSRKALTTIVDDLTSALFPNRLSVRDLSDASVDFFVGRTLDSALRELADQLVRESSAESHAEVSESASRARALSIVGRFAARLPEIRALLEADIYAVFQGDPAARSIDEVLACYPGVLAITHYRLAHAMWDLGATLTARVIGAIAHSRTGIDIHPGARIGKSFFVDHGTGVVIGETAVVGDRVRIYHGVTLGAKSPPPVSPSLEAAPTGDTGRTAAGRHPVIGDDVVIYAGATLLGSITIGRAAVIGGNVCLTKDVPPETIITQAVARTEDHDSGSGI
jgi:serine O-acetyltransferase